MSRSTLDAAPAQLAERYRRQYLVWSTSIGESPDVAEDLWRRALLDPAAGFLERAGKEFRARLVRDAYRLAGGEERKLPSELPLIVEVLHAGSLIIDDIQDRARTRRGAPALHRMIGTPLAINTGNLLYSWALELVGELPLDAATVLAIYRDVSRTMLMCHHGQALDLIADVRVLAQREVAAVTRAVTERKAGALMELSARIGARAAGCDSAHEPLARHGRSLGEALQKLDDLSSVAKRARVAKAFEDLRNARPTWVWAWLAESSEPDEYDALRDRLELVDDEANAAKLAQDLVARIGSHGRRVVHEELTGSLVALRGSVGPSPVLDALGREVERLEVEFG